MYVYPVSSNAPARFLRRSLSDGWGKSSEPKKLANVIAEQGDGDTSEARRITLEPLQDSLQ